MSQANIDVIDVELLEVEENILSKNDEKAIQESLKSILKTFSEHKDLSPVKCLEFELRNQLPEKSDEERAEISNKIISTIKIQDEKKKSLEKAIANGRSKESWFAKEVQSYTDHMKGQEATAYLKSLDSALENANSEMLDTILTKSGTVSNNRNLDGFIAEQAHANTFNLKAESTGSEYRAEVLKPDGVYGKNSVDIVIRDKNNDIVRRYQSKYCKGSQSTEQSFEKGDYRGQQKLIPEGQEIQKKHTTFLEAPDGTTSKPLSKENAKELQKDAQYGNWQDKDYNDYELKDISLGVGKEVCKAGSLSFVSGGLSSILNQAIHEEEIDSEKVLEDAVKSAADTSAKVAVAGAIKIASEKSLIHCLPKGTPADIFATMGNVAVENTKILYQIGKGELTFKEGRDKAEQVTLSTVAGVMTSTSGAAIGASIGLVFGPIGSAVGGAIGGSIGYMMGSTAMKAVVKGTQIVRDKVDSTIKSIRKSVVSSVKSVASKVFNFLFG